MKKATLTMLKIVVTFLGYTLKAILLRRDAREIQAERDQEAQRKTVGQAESEQKGQIPNT